MSGNYDDLRKIPYPFALERPRMTMRNRAAQFSPFSALTGYEAAVMDTVQQVQQEAEWASAGEEADEGAQLLRIEKEKMDFFEDQWYDKHDYQTGGGNL